MSVSRRGAITRPRRQTSRKGRRRGANFLALLQLEILADQASSFSNGSLEPEPKTPDLLTALQNPDFQQEEKPEEDKIDSRLLAFLGLLEHQYALVGIDIGGEEDMHPSTRAMHARLARSRKEFLSSRPGILSKRLGDAFHMQPAP
jgi:hypothetical protein